jgi:hypothetical protein
VGDDDRRQAALSAAWQRFPAVAEKVRQVYGLRLPRHLAVYWALWTSADEGEKHALDCLGGCPAGVMDYFRDDGLRLAGRDGLDERLHYRYMLDPAEFVTVRAGGGDGLHHGLWYDDPAELPSFIAHNYAKDSAETWTSGLPTVLAELRHDIDGELADLREDAGMGVRDDSELEEFEAEVTTPLLGALDWFADADRLAVEADGRPRWATAARQDWISVSPALPEGSGDPRLAEWDARSRDFGKDGPAAGQWIALAREELAAGQPALALAVGSELHWLSGGYEPYRLAARDLRAGAYRALGRDALAGIVDVHAAHPGLSSVEVLMLP